MAAAPEAAAADGAFKLAKLKAPAALEAAKEAAAGVDVPNKPPAAAEGAPKRPVEGVDGVAPNPPEEKLGWELGAAAAGWLPAPADIEAPGRPPACIKCCSLSAVGHVHVIVTCSPPTKT